MVLRIRLIGLLFTFLLGFISASAQDIPATSDGDLKIYVDHTAFKGKDNKTYEEFYLMLHADDLNYGKVDGKGESNFNVSAVIKDKEGKKISQRDWQTSTFLEQDAANLKGFVIYDQWAELLSSGVYNVIVKVAAKEKSSGEVEFNLNVPSFNEKSLTSSEIEFITRTEEAKENSPFVKGNRSYIPNPWRRYGLLNPMLSFYYEIYNLDNSLDDKTLSVDYSIVDKNQNIIKEIPAVEVKKSGKDISVVHAIDISKIKSGIYSLIVNINDHLRSHKISRDFEIIQADYFTKNSLNNEDVEIAGSLLKYIATPGEYKFYESLDLSGKANYLIRFWNEKDPVPETTENEYLQTIKNRFHYANKNFSWGPQRGWETDRGRILIKYGMPDDIEDHFSESGSTPYEIWNYTRDKSFIFVFADVNSSGNYTLLHSTKEGEVSNYNWKDFLRSYNN